MSQTKIDNGTIILDPKGTEIGTIKKIYSENLARLELTNAESIAFDVSLVSTIEVSGRILKKKTAVISNDFNLFFKGASETLENLLEKFFEQIADQLDNKEIKKSLQYFEFDCLEKNRLDEKLPFWHTLGIIRGVELASKTSQDFLVKNVFKAAEKSENLKQKIAPEILVDKLTQEKAHYRILWNVVRVAIQQAINQKDPKLVLAIKDPLFEIGLKFIDNELKETSEEKDILYWQERIEECIFSYLAALLRSLPEEEQQQLLQRIQEEKIDELKKLKVNSMLKEQTIKNFESFSLENYDNKKTVELLHAGLKGFNLRVMAEKKAMKTLKENLMKVLQEEEKSNKIITLQKELSKFTQEVRDVSKEFQSLLIEIRQFLKKIEYGDSKVKDYYTSLYEKCSAKNYQGLSEILALLKRNFMEK
ncbi:MAG: hypothetical protein K9W42_01110 [Candidatus Heimdallarchaeota archaeon]|nr:hypothetical protein [Candidatus Heimdallarchaeota archaeon]